MASLKANVALNFVNTLMGIIYPVVTFPYAARILLPEGIGAVNFLNSIVAYIVLFTSLGIPMYAVREIAKYRDDVVNRNKITLEILMLSCILAAIGYVVVWALAAFVPQIHSQCSLFYVLSLTILFTAVGVQWFYQGIEDFKFITIRGIVVRSIAAASLFIFVKAPSDLLIYGFIVVGSTVGNNIWNFVHLRKYIPVADIEVKNLSILRHLKPSIKIFVLNLIISIYINLNTIMLGFIQDDTAVGIYTAGNKISHIALTVVTSLGVVMLPRCANLISNGRIEEFKKASIKAIKLVMATSFPCMAALIILAPQIILVFCGKDFLDAVPVLIWTVPVILVVGISNVIGIQILYPYGKENIVILSTLGGALFNIVLNTLLIPRYSYIGAAISTLIAEIVVTIIQICVGRKFIPFKFNFKLISNYFIATIVMAIILSVSIHIIDNPYLAAIICIIEGLVIYLVMLSVLKDSLFKEILRFAHVIK